MKVLIVEDDATSRKVLHKFLEPYGKCDLAADGYDALDLFQEAMEKGAPYNLVCLDIMMPGMTGQQVLEEIRKKEAEKDIHGLDGVKIVMTTALSDPTNILQAFRAQCEAYLLKPLDRQKLLDALRSLGLLK